MHRILIIEDNKVTTDYLCQGLRENYFIVEVAHNGLDGLFLINEHDYDVIVLDVMMPILDGYAVIEHIRQRNPDVPVIFLTAKDTIDDRVKGLDLGADDYLVKPFAFSELVARIRSLLRRKQPFVMSPLAVADLIIDVAKHKVTRAGQEMTLTTKEFMLLQLFITRQGEVLSRTYIAQQVWDIHFDSDTNVIDVAIKRLRDKVDKGFEPKLLHSVRGVGYVLEAR